VLRQQRFEQQGDLLAALATLEPDDGLAGVIVDRPDAVAPVRLGGRKDHHLPPLRAPHRPQRRQPAQVELVGGVEIWA